MINYHMRAVKRALAIFVFILISCASQRAEQLPIRTYTTADGLPRDRIYKIVADPRGFLWFCTYDGLSRFDGYEFVNYSIAQGLPHRVVYDLLITRSGEYLVATSNGLARFNPLAANGESKFKTYLPTGRPDAEVLTHLYEDSSATIWVGTGNGFHKLRQNGDDWQIEYVNLGERPDEQLDVTSVVEDAPGVLWIGTEQGLFRRFSDGHAERFSTKDGLPHQHVRALLRELNGTVWVATGLGLCRLVSSVRVGQPVVARVYTKKDGLMNEGIFSLFRASTGRLWLATMQGITEFVTDTSSYSETFINYTREHGLSDAGIRTIAEDHDGNLWLGSESGGAMKITRRGFTSYSEGDGLEHGRIAALGEDRNGELFVVTGSLKSPSFHIHRFDGRRFENFRVNTPAGVFPTWGWNQLFVEDRSQQWWVPMTTGLFQFPPVHSVGELARVRPAKIYTPQNGLSGNEPFRLYEDSHGDIWISIISGPSNAYLNRFEPATGKFLHTGRTSRRERTARRLRFRKIATAIFGSDFTGVVCRAIATASLNPLLKRMVSRPD